MSRIWPLHYDATTCADIPKSNSLTMFVSIWELMKGVMTSYRWLFAPLIPHARDENQGWRNCRLEDTQQRSYRDQRPKALGHAVESHADTPEDNVGTQVLGRGVTLHKVTSRQLESEVRDVEHQGQSGVLAGAHVRVLEETHDCSVVDWTSPRSISVTATRNGAMAGRCGGRKSHTQGLVQILQAVTQKKQRHDHPVDLAHQLLLIHLGHQRRIFMIEVIEGSVDVNQLHPLLLDVNVRFPHCGRWGSPVSGYVLILTIQRRQWLRCMTYKAPCIYEWQGKGRNTQDGDIRDE